MSNDARLDFCRRLAADAGRLAHRSFGRAQALPGIALLWPAAT